MRVFPLVPAKYRERGEHPRITTPSEQDSAIAVDSASDRSMPDETISEAVSMASSVRDGKHHGDSARGEASPVLIPAAEVFQHNEADYDDWSSSRSTCSSMPALSEGETATPEQSLLITPSQARHSSLKSQGQFFNDFGHGEPSSPLLLTTPDLSETAYQTVNLAGALTMPKASMNSTTRAFHLGRDKTPTSASTETLESTGISNETDIGSIEEQRCSQDADACDAPKVCGVPQPASHDEASSGLGVVHDSDLERHGFIGSECESSEATQRLSQHEGWLLHCVENVNEGDDAVPENTIYPRTITTVTECESSDTLRTQVEVLDNTIVKSGLSELSAPQARLNSDFIEWNHLLRQDCQEAVTPVSESSRVAEAASSSSPDHALTTLTQMRDLSVEDELSRSKVDFFEADDEGTDSEELVNSRAVGDLQPAAPSLQLGEVSESRYVMPNSDPEQGVSQCPETVRTSDSERKHLGFGPSHEAVPDTLPDLSCSQKQPSPPDKRSPMTISLPSVDEVVRDGVLNSPSTAKSDLNSPVQGVDSHSPLNHSAVLMPIAPSPDVRPGPVPAERTPTQADFLFASQPSKHGHSQPLTEAQPMTASDGPKSSLLLPSLPVFASLGPTANQSRASFQSSSSEWEDCVSEARQSSDSVDTIQKAPSLSDHDIGTAERPGSPKRLGTPTAGILGLHESRWADFGIRGALTGSHAFDRPSTAPMLSAERAHGERVETRCDKTDEDGEVTPRPRPATPHRKSLHLLHHKKSISSIIFPGTHHGHQIHQQGKPTKLLSKKESKELKAREKSKAKPKAKENGKPGGADSLKGQDAGDAGRFPRAMMLITGLAIASSVVNRGST